MKLLKFGLLVMLAVVWSVSNASANPKQLKTYREVFPEFKPKCFYCHVDKVPKKADGKHDLNAYGLKLQELMGGEKLTAEMIQSVGNHEEFEKNMMEDATETVEE